MVVDEVVRLVTAVVAEVIGGDVVVVKGEAVEEGTGVAGGVVVAAVVEEVKVERGWEIWDESLSDFFHGMALLER